MKFLIFLFILNCSSLAITHEKKTIARQVDGARDLCEKMEDPDRRRCDKFMNNIIESEKSKDSIIEKSSNRLGNQSEEIKNLSEDSGKAQGYENFYFAIIGFILLVVGSYFGFQILKKRFSGVA